MPPRPKIDKDMIIGAAIEIIRESGYESLNVRRIAEQLGCSTQPVLYHFRTVEEIKKAAYMAVDEYHSEYLVRGTDTGNPLKTLGRNYIRFGYEEKNLFRFLMQSDGLTGGMQGLFDDGRLTPILELLSKQMNCDRSRAKLLFSALFFTVHGIAGLLANNSIEYDEQWLVETLNTVYQGVVKEVLG